MRKTLNFIKDPFLASLKAKEHGLNSLDLMCGWGRSTQVLYQWYFESMGRRCNKRGNAYMIDFTNPMLTVAKLTKLKGNPNVTIHNMDATSIPWLNFFPIHFDIVTCWWNLCYIRAKGKMALSMKKLNYLRGIRGVLRDEGYLILSEPISLKPE